METKSQTGYLVLADISGFTSYLAKTELEHAHEILADLMTTIVDRLAKLLVVSKLEGDAVFAYAPDARLARGETLLELIEATYLAFRDRQSSMHRSTTCTCNACKNIGGLDLKFMAHHGEFILQRVADRSELIGSDVNLAHRLMKNRVIEATGWPAYALFTQRCLDRMGIAPEGWHAQTEVYEHLGEVPTRVLNLRERHQELAEQRRVLVSEAEAHAVLVRELNAPPPVVWEWLSDAAKRTKCQPGSPWSTVALPSGRMGVGAVNHCAHGKDTAVETILDWRPFEYMTNESRFGKIVMLQTIRLEPIGEGRRTRLYDQIRVVEMPLPRLLRGPALRLMLKMLKYDQMYKLMARYIDEESPSPAAQAT